MSISDEDDFKNEIKLFVQKHVSVIMFVLNSYKAYQVYNDKYSIFWRKRIKIFS